MNMQEDFEADVIEWHKGQGGFAGDAAGHAVRLLRECVELCVASGATLNDMEDAFYVELKKEMNRRDLGKDYGLAEKLEEFADVTLLSIVYRQHFLPPRLVSNALRLKLDICRGRQWRVDASGVLWRPGTGPAATPQDGGESS